MRTLLRGFIPLLRIPRSRPGLVPSLPRAKYRDQVRNPLVLSGFLSWLGISQQSEPENDLLITIKRGILAVQEGDLKRADQIFHIALKMAFDIGHEEGITHIYCLLANTALERGLVGQAERLFTDILKRLLSSGEPQDSNAVVEISLKLAQIFSGQNNLQKAEQGFEFCTKTQQLKVEKEGSACSEDTLALYGLCLDKSAQFYLGQGRLDQAESGFRSAVLLSSRIHGEEHEQTLVINNSLASVLSLKGETNQAVTLLSRIITTAESTSCQYLPTFLINRGIIELRAGLIDKAELDCTRAREAAKSLKDEEARREATECINQIKSATG